MQVGTLDISKISHIPSANDYNKLVEIINILRKINLGPGMTGNIGSAGISLDTRIGTTFDETQTFPYGDTWCWGLQLIPSASDTIVRVYNPVVQRAGVTTSNWFSIEPLGGGGIPDKVYLTQTIGDSDWEDANGNGRVIIYHKYDTALNTETIEKTKLMTEACTLPNDGAGTVEPIRYYLTPLYVLSANRKNGTTGNFINQKIWMDLIHGLYVPSIWS